MSTGGNYSWVGPVVGAAAGYFGAQDWNDRNGGPQNSSSNTTSWATPWGPDAGWRQFSVDYLGNLLANPQAIPQYRGGGGPSQNTQDLLGRITQRAGGNDPLSDATRGALTQAVSGFGNPWMEQAGSSLSQFLNQGVGPMGQTTFNFAQGMRNPQLDQTVQALMGTLPGQQGGGNLFGPGGSWGGGNWGGGGGGGGDVSSFMRPYLEGILGGNLPPGLQQLMDSASAQTTEAYQQGLAGLSAGASGAGRYGSSAHQLADAQAAQRYAQALADQQASMRLEPFMAAMGHGTSLDQALIGAQAQLGSANASAGASMHNTLANLALQEAMGNRGFLMDALGMQNQMSLGGLGAMTTLSGLESSNQQFGLGGLLQGAGLFDQRQLGAMGLANQFRNDEFDQLMAAFGASSGLDGDRAGNAMRQYQAAMDQYNTLWQNGLRTIDGINAATLPFMTQYQVGGSTTPGQSVSPLSQALAGGLSGWAAQSGNLFGTRQT